MIDKLVEDFFKLEALDRVVRKDFLRTGFDVMKVKEFPLQYFIINYSLYTIGFYEVKK